MKIQYPRFMKKEELERILSYLKTDSKPQFYLIFLMQASLGLRISEILNLRLQDIDSDYKGAVFYLKKQDKASKRQIPEELGEELKKYIRKNISNILRSDNFIFFTRTKNKHIQTSSCRWILRRALKDLNLDDYITINNNKYHRIGTHSFRRFFITNVAKKNGLTFAQKIIGHVKIETCLRYINTLESAEEKRIINDIFKDIKESTITKGQTRLIESERWIYG